MERAVPNPRLCLFALLCLPLAVRVGVPRSFGRRNIGQKNRPPIKYLTVSPEFAIAQSS